MSSIFSRIVAGEIPCYKVAETDRCLAFLDISPLSRGHVLCVPKQEVDKFFELDDDLYQALTLFAKRVATAIAAAIPCQRVGVAVVGLDVPHAHIHLIPLHTAEDINFNKEHLKLSQQEMQEIANAIHACYKA